MPATVIPIGDPVNAAERAVVAALRDGLPSSYTLVHNFELHRDQEIFEVDLAVLAPHAVYLVDVKGTRGLIDVFGPHWYPEGRDRFSSPLPKLRAHARSFKGMLTEAHPGRRDLEDVYVDAAVILSAADAHLSDQGGRDIGAVTSLRDAVAFFQNTARIPPRFSRAIGPLHKMVLAAIQGTKGAPRRGPLVFGDWEVVERLAASDGCEEFRVVSRLAGRGSTPSMLRLYQVDLYAPKDAQERRRHLISNAFRALDRLPGHPRIGGVRAFFETEDGRFALVTEDAGGQPLRAYIAKASLALTVDQKLKVARELLEGLAWCHQHGVVHRNVTPGTVRIGADGHVRLTGFDYARSSVDPARTVAPQIVDRVDAGFAAPEAWHEPGKATSASDVFAAGLVLHELFAGAAAFQDATEMFERSAVFVAPPSSRRPELPGAVDAWLQSLCTFAPEHRPTAEAALQALDVSFGWGPPPTRPAALSASPGDEPDWAKLPRGTILGTKLEVQERLGAGGFGVVYRVVDTLGDVTRAMKLILKDRHSTLERLKTEYRALLHLPEHPRVVRVIDADVLPQGGPPYLLFEYIQGDDVGRLIDQRRFAPDDALDLLRQVAEGLEHLHRHQRFHFDIKPRNVMWTSRGAVLIDFNVSVDAAAEGHGGGTGRYLPPDLDRADTPTLAEKADRDLYALGLTAWQALTGGGWPWSSERAVPGAAVPDPRDLPGLSDLTPELVAVLQRLLHPRRGSRFASATELRAALDGVLRARRDVFSESSGSVETASAGPADTNPFVTWLRTLYSQSKRSNAGTRGLDALGRKTYVATLLDEQLLPEVLDGRLRLVIITGNAGDGKTAFLQQLEDEACKRLQVVHTEALPNGRAFATQTRRFRSNYDGSQDEQGKVNDEVLRELFDPYAGNDPSAWPSAETRLIAINEGRLVDFLTTHAATFPHLRRLVDAGLRTGAEDDGVAVVNLNLRSVVTTTRTEDGSILRRLVLRLTDERRWESCLSCSLKDRCYALHNARTFQDPTAGPVVLERLEELVGLTHLRGRLHITLRDLRSAMAFMLTSGRSCAEIAALYAGEHREEIARSYYYNAWMAAGVATSDRLLVLLRGVDPGTTADPALDRAIDFVSPTRDRSLFALPDRSTYEHEVVRARQDALPRATSTKSGARVFEVHQRFVADLRRRAFFERRDEGWRAMLPYRAAARLLALVRGEASVQDELPILLRAINRGEGLSDPARLGGGVALQVRRVERGTIKSYRLFPPERFALRVRDAAERARFVEHMPDALVLTYAGDGVEAELVINLDMFEMLARLDDGYRPSIEDEQGAWLSLAVFKNLLGSAPYQEILLTTTGHAFWRVRRSPDGRLAMQASPASPVPGSAVLP